MRVVRALAALLMALVAGALVATAALASWAESTVVSTTGFTAAVGPLSDHPQVQAELTTAVSDKVLASVQAAVDSAPFPVNQLGGLVPQLRDPITEAVTTVLASDAASSAWTTTVATLHEQTVASIRGQSSGVALGDGTATIDLNTLRQPILDGIDLPDPLKAIAGDIDLGTITITTGTSPQVLATGVRLAGNWQVILLVGVLLVALSAVVARRAGWGLVLAGLAIIAFSAGGYARVSGQLATSTAPDPLSRSLELAIEGSLEPALRQSITYAVASGVAVLVVGLVVVVATALVGRARRTPA